MPQTASKLKCFWKPKAQRSRPARRGAMPFRLFRMVPNSIVPLDVNVIVAKLGDAKETDALIRASQELRFKEFFLSDPSAKPSAEMLKTRREEDEFDAHCDHILVISHDKVVASSRVYRWSVAKEHNGLYTAGEFNLDETVANITAQGFDVAELGRTCIDSAYQGSFILIKALFGEIGRYAEVHNIGALIGCASIHGTNPEKVADLLSHIGHNYMAPEGLRPTSKAPMTPVLLKEPDAIDRAVVNEQMPPLLKFYTRILKGYVGPEAFIDHQFNCMDMFILVMMADVDGTQKSFFMRTSADK